MSSLHEESLLSKSLSIEDLHDCRSSPASVFLEESKNEKFGIENTYESTVPHFVNTNADGNDKIDREVSSFCRSFSNLSTNSGAVLSGKTSSLSQNVSQDYRHLSDSDALYCYSSSSCSTSEDLKGQV